MFCHDCGSKLEENSIVCTKCGTVIDRSSYKKLIKKKSNNMRGIICFVFSIISMFLCFNFLLKDISEVGMYTKFIEKLYYGLNLVFIPLFASFIALIISYGEKDDDKFLSKIGLFLSIVSLLIIIIEIVIVMVY